MSLVLYRKYRPKNFNEIVGQEKTVKILTSAIQSDRISHAYLFTEPRGTGKTTIARILAKAINCTNRKNGEPCDKCINCTTINSGRTFDIVEIDAASNTGIDNIRELKESIGFSPTNLKYKVFIIDEVHMLSKGAFNALLKMLEEPPKHAVFILATTEVHKIPPTIISRVQRFDFRKFKLSEITDRLKNIIKKENVKVEKGVLEVIALSADGGMRDAESMLGQIISLESNDKEIKLEEVKIVLGLTNTESILQFTELLSKNKTKEAIIFLNEIIFEGQDIEQFIGSLIEILRKIVVLKTNNDLKKYILNDSTEDQAQKILKLVESFNEKELLWLFKKIITAKNEIKSSVLPQIPIEIVLIEYDYFKNSHKIVNDLKNKVTLSNSTKKKLNLGKNDVKSIETQEISKEKKSINEEESRDIKIIKEDNETGKISEEIGIEEIKLKWNYIVKNTKKYNHSISAFLKLSIPQKIKKDKLIIATPYKFHAEKLNDATNFKIINKVFLEVFPILKNIKISITQDENVKVFKTSKVEEKIDNEKVNFALEVFGGTVE